MLHPLLNNTICTLFVITLVTCASNSYAVTSERIKVLTEKAEHLQLWRDKEWLNLLYYKGDGEQAKDYSSQVSDSRFFIVEDGKENPVTELNATITNILSSTEESTAARCRFVARSNWLIEKLTIEKAELPEVQCIAYDEWRKHVQPQQVTLIFPTYHLNSPSSMYGHTLLRLDPEKDKGESKWLSVAVNFGANVPEGENSILYTYRGLFGGYRGLFITDHYFKKIQEYNRIEHRDIWEYHLNLNQEETERLVQHVWEVQDITFPYYFFDENCSYRILELLEIARPEVELTEDYIVTAIPIDTVKTVKDAGMVENVSYRPARVTTLSYMINNIPESQRSLAISLSEDISTLENDEFKRLTAEEQSNIIDIAYNYLRYKQSGNARDKQSSRRSFQLLKARTQYARGEKIKLPEPVKPDEGHHSKRVSVALGQRLNNNYAELGFKMSFHDLEDNIHGFLQGAQINMFTGQLRAEENEGVSLYKLDIIDIFSLTPRNQFFSPMSWRIYSGLERQYTKNVDQLTLHVTGGGGGSWALTDDSQFYTLATGRLEANKQMDHAIEPALGFAAGLLAHFTGNTARLEFSGEHFPHDMYRLRAQYTHNFVINSNNSIKLYAKHEWQENDTEFSDINLGYQYYF